MQSKELTPLPPWGSALAGATGAVLANAVVYPLDIVKTRLQVQTKRKAFDDNEPYYVSTSDALQKIVAEDGLEGLYAGMTSSLIGVASTNFAYFYWYSVIRTLYVTTQKFPSPPSTAAELSLGALAGALAQVFTIPVSVVTTRQQTQSKSERKGLIETAKEVVHSEDGWTGLWRGLKASLVLVVNPAITYGAYQKLREVLFPGKVNLRPWEAFILGALCKAIATLLTQPLIVAKVGLQSRPPPERKGRPFKSFVEVMRYIVRHEGLRGLLKGIGPQLMKGLMVQGLLMMTKERTEILFAILFRYIREMKATQLRRVVDSVASARPSKVTPVVVVIK
ncbi:MAG: hypothetical protein M1823_002989 [Watsoniomyces obsoletus]|nr:MAG: hypothetical protein M1823_002989 [Watsoniomyces obsoletus]